MVYSPMVPSLLKVGFHILLLFLLFSFHVDRAMSTNDYVGEHCNDTASYSAGDAFEANMKSVFSTLTNDAPPALFANVTAGGGSDRVYGLVQCRGDVDQDTCNACISTSINGINDTDCLDLPKDAIIWYEKCQLRYSNTNFFGRLNVDDHSSSDWSKGQVQQPENFTKTLDGLLKKLTYQATTEPSSRFMFATGNIPYEDLQTLYGLVQCTMDTSLADCSQCLTSTISQIPSTCKNADGPENGCEIVTGSCRVRFGTELFYTPTPNQSPPPNPALPSNSSLSPSPNSAPPLNSTQSPSLSTGSSNTSSEKVNHSSVISVTMITVVTFSLTSMYLLIVPAWL